MGTTTTALLAFNLVCTGDLTTASAILGDSSKPYVAEYRIDLNVEKWCEAECKTLHGIASIQPTQITLDDSKETDSTFGETATKNFVDRETGAHSILVTSGKKYQSLSMTWKGQCERKPFTGFPKFETKF